MLDRILVPLDGSDLSDRILAPVARLAARTGAEVRAVRVLDGFTADQAMLRGEDPRDIAAAELGRALAPLRAAGLAVTYDTYIGDAATRILDDADGYRPSIIAMATHGRSGADRWFRGSTCERVLRRSSVPVFIANPRSIEQELAVSRILVPLDGSALSAAVLPVAVEFARVFDAELLLLHVVEGATPFATQTTEDALALLEPFARSLAGVRVRTMAAKGSAAFAILETAREAAVDLVAMTTHGRTGPSRWVFGSAAEHVLHQCSAPLLVVRTSGHAEGAKGAEASRTFASTH